MKVYIAIKFDKREVGTCIDIPESTANRLIEKGIVTVELKSKKVETNKKEKKNEKDN